MTYNKRIHSLSWEVSEDTEKYSGEESVSIHEKHCSGYPLYLKKGERCCHWKWLPDFKGNDEKAK